MSAAELPPPPEPTVAANRPSPLADIVRLRLEPMRSEDVADVAQVERRSFANPWPTSAYRRELQNREQNYYIVLRAELPIEDAGDRPGPRPLPRRGLLPISFGRRSTARQKTDPVVGFAGMWNAFDEAHVTTIAVDAPWRGHGFGELLLAALFDEAGRRGANWLTLEVRVSNESAQALYRKWGFSVQGARRRYYSDNNEDAHVMWSRAISDPGFRDQLARLRRGLFLRLSVPVAGFPETAPPMPAGPPAGKPPWEV